MKGVKLAYFQIAKWKTFYNGSGFTNQKTSVELTNQKAQIKLIYQKYITMYLNQNQNFQQSLRNTKPSLLKTYTKLLWKPTKSHFAYKGKSFRVLNQKKKTDLF